MTSQFERLRRMIWEGLGNLTRYCGGKHRQRQRGAANGSRRSFLRTAPGLLGLGCAVAPTFVGAQETPPEEKRTSSQRWEELSASDLVKALEQTSLVYVPIGTLEFHGAHLPLGTDAIHSYELCLAAAKRTGGVVLPATHWSPHGHEGWAGSLLVREETFRALLTDVFTLLCEQGVKFIVACTGHYPAKQEPAIRKIADEVVQRFPETRFLVLGPWCHPTDPSADHGGKKETALMLSLRPALVHMERLSGPEAMRGISASAVDGTAQFGKDYFSAEVDNFVNKVNEARQPT
ncbi:MAG: creatininase family protein [Planctomycetes bacterium]|nr:creatininase family protein [Planctomycetota bacterium]MBL7038303.1 creatininase family protein [Pirellulaceae bacterium]